MIELAPNQGCLRQPLGMDVFQPELVAAGKKYIPGLDGLRALSVISVILAHAGFSRYIPANFGVTVFFFISGFLITNLLISENAKYGRVSVRAFYVRRYLRLTPELVVFIAACTALSCLAYEVRWLDVWGSLFYFQNYVRIFFPPNNLTTPLNFSHLWSLSIEEHFYMIMPLVFVAIKRDWRWFAFALTVGCVVVGVFRVWAFECITPYVPDGGSRYTHRATEARIDSIIYGCLFATIGRYVDLRRWINQLRGVCCLIIALLLVALSLLYRNRFFLDTWVFSVQGMALVFGFLGLYFCRIGHVLLALLEQRHLRICGRISYGIYLWHMLPIWIARRWSEQSDRFLDDWSNCVLLALVSFTFSIIAGLGSERLLLRPMRGLRNRFGSVDPRAKIASTG